MILISIEILKKIALFEGLEESDLAKLAQVTQAKNIPTGGTLFKEGDVGDAFYLLVEGAVDVIKLESGAEKIVSTIAHTDKNNFFGEMALIEGAPRNATLKAAKDCRVLFIEKSNFDMMLRLNSFIALRIMTALSKRFRSQSEPAGEQKVGKVISVFSPKSGSGKSIFVANLSAGLAKLYKGKVLLIDLDLQFGDQAFMLGLKPKRTIADLIEHPSDKMEVIKEYLIEHKEGFFVLSAPTKPEQSEMINSSHLRTIVDIARKHFDYIVLDLHSLFQDLTINAMDMADMVFLMMVPNMNHIKNMMVCLKVMENLKYAPEKIKLIMNRDGSANSRSREDIETGLKRKVDFVLADDYSNVIQLIDNQRTVFEVEGSSAYRQALGVIIEALTGKNPTGEKSDKGLMGTIKGWFS